MLKPYLTMTSPPQFNLAIKDIPEVTHEAKKALAGQLPGIGRSMCVEISLKTSEVKTKNVLETACSKSLSFQSYFYSIFSLSRYCPVWIISQSSFRLAAEIRFLVHPD